MTIQYVEGCPHMDATYKLVAEILESRRYWIKTELDSEGWKALPGGLFDGSIDRARSAFDTMSQAFDDAASRFF